MTLGWSTTWADGVLDGSNGWTDSWQSATPTVLTGQSEYTSGRALRVAMPASGAGTPGSGAGATDGSSQRCENYADLTAITGTGDFDWADGFAAYFGLLVTFTTMPINYSNWQLITQWKNSGSGSPPCELSVNGGRMYLDGNSGGWSIDVMTPVEGQTYKIILGLTLTSSAATSNINAWVNDTQYLSNAKPTGSGLMYAGKTSYWKYGCYRSASPAPGAALIDFGAVAASLDSYQDVSDFLDANLASAGPPPPSTTPVLTGAARASRFHAAM